MKKELFQLILDDAVERKVFAAFPDLRDGIFVKQNLQNARSKIKKDAFFRAVVGSDQDPEEILKMVLESFDRANDKLRKKIQDFYLLVVNPAIEEEKKEK